MSLLRLMSSLADRGWKVDLLLTTGGGSLESAIDPRVRVRYLRGRAAGSRFKAARGLGRVGAMGDALVYGYARIQALVRGSVYLLRRYDAAAASLTGMSNFFVRRIVRARVRLHWIRSDLTGCDPTGRIARSFRRTHARIDHYICVSETARRSLVERVPGVAHKAHVIYNLLRPEDMRLRVEAADSPFTGVCASIPKVVTVCRLNDRAKALRRMVSIHRRLAAEGLDFYWFVVGDGPDRAMIEREADDAGLSHRFLLVGHEPNPFRYYAHADLVAMVSYYEGLPGVVNEAKVTGLPVLATRVSGIEEQLIDGVSGRIVENDEEAILDGLRELLTEPAALAALRNSVLPTAIMDDDAKIQALERLISPSPVSP